MERIQNIAFMLLSLVFLCPAALWATRGSDDYGLFLGAIFLLFSMPAGLAMVVFIILSCMRLFRKEPATDKRGKVVVRLSLAVAGLSVIIAALFIGTARADHNVVTTVLAVLLPVFMLSGLSATLARFSGNKQRSR